VDIVEISIHRCKDTASKRECQLVRGARSSYARLATQPADIRVPLFFHNPKARFVFEVVSSQRRRSLVLDFEDLVAARAPRRRDLGAVTLGLAD
jgi:hypothetical protein